MPEIVRFIPYYYRALPGSPSPKHVLLGIGGVIERSVLALRAEWTRIDAFLLHLPSCRLRRLELKEAASPAASMLQETYPQHDQRQANRCL